MEENGTTPDSAPEGTQVAFSADWQGMHLRGLLEMQVLELCSKGLGQELGVLISPPGYSNA